MNQIRKERTREVLPPKTTRESTVMTAQLRKSWAHLLSKTTLTAKQATRGDDAVVRALFSQVNKRAADKQHVVASLGSVDSQISDVRVQDLRNEFEAVKENLLAPAPTFRELNTRAETFLRRPSVQIWSDVTLGKKYRVAFEW